MDITDIVKNEEKENQKLKDLEKMVQSNSYTIPDDAGFLTDIDELTQLLQKNLINLYSDPAKVTEDLMKKVGSMVALLDKYIDTRRNIYMLTKVKLPL